LAPSWISRRLGFRAVWNFAPRWNFALFGISRRFSKNSVKILNQVDSLAH
jgi:hypothetical protein